MPPISMYANRPGRFQSLAAGLLTLLVGLGFFLGGQAGGAQAADLQQQPTSVIPTVTSTPSGPIARAVTDQNEINVRSGPSRDYPRIGVLIPGQQVPVLGRTPGGDWTLISYPGVPGNVGWVFSALLVIPPAAALPIIEPPPTPTPRVTPTIDPTLAAQFIVDLPPTSLPTFTQPPPLAIPTFPADEPAGRPAGIPMGLPIAILGAIGLFAALISVLRGG